ncbi:DUF1971 domain-containing protein [Shewanella sp. UCD-KL12]|uniref:DUF1971 domain-containing protein n=1 Tax=Shewanella sp. UCD-KL12 TaxID=1917163 RepID=UPI00097103C2|nr:DUF1971 domain-containing protein [Shewanella sp. UCD-KL12]
MSCVPKGYVSYKSTKVFTKTSTPAALLEPHITKPGFYEQVHVLHGELAFYGYCDNHTKTDKQVRVKQNETAISHPYYWHRIEPLTDDTEFEIHFFKKV